MLVVVGGCSRSTTNASEVERDLRLQIVAANRKLAARLVVSGQVADANKKSNELSAQVRLLKEQNAALHLRINQLSSDKEGHASELTRPHVKGEADLRIELIEWIVERDRFRKRLSVESTLSSEAINVIGKVSVKRHVDLMRERALQVDNYGLAAAILEENRQLLEQKFDKDVATWKRLSSDFPENLRKSVIRTTEEADVSLRQIGQDRIAIEKKFNGQ